jgi:hypothetical protein
MMFTVLISSEDGGHSLLSIEELEEAEMFMVLLLSFQFLSCWECDAISRYLPATGTGYARVDAVIRHGRGPVLRRLSYRFSAEVGN